MGNKDILLRFFELENKRDWINYEALLHPDVEWTLFDDEGSEIISGLENYMSRMKSAYGEGEASFSCESVYSSRSGSRVVTILVNNRGQRSADIFEFENGLIKKEWEFLLG